MKLIKNLSKRGKILLIDNGTNERMRPLITRFTSLQKLYNSRHARSKDLNHFTLYFPY